MQRIQTPYIRRSTQQEYSLGSQLGPVLAQWSSTLPQKIGIMQHRTNTFGWGESMGNSEAIS